MADNVILSAALELHYVPDTYTETELREGASWELGAGHYDLVANVDGVLFLIQRLKGGGVQKKLAAAKKARESNPPAQQQPPEQPEAPSTEQQ